MGNDAVWRPSACVCATTVPAPGCARARNERLFPAAQSPSVIDAHPTTPNRTTIVATASARGRTGARFPVPTRPGRSGPVGSKGSHAIAVRHASVPSRYEPNSSSTSARETSVRLEAK